MEYSFTDSQIDVVRSVLEDAGISNRILLADALQAGSAAVAGFYAAKSVKIERAAHIVWGMLDYFPSEDKAVL